MRRYSVVSRAVSLAWTRPALFSGVAAATFVSALATGVIDPLVQKHLFDVLAERRFTGFVGIALLMVVFFTALRSLAYVTGVATRRLQNELTREQVLRQFDRFCTIDFEEVVRRDNGYFTSRVYEEPARAVPEALTLVLNLAGASVTLIGAAMVCLWLSWPLALVLSLVVPVILYLARRFGDEISGASMRASESEAALRADLGRSLAAYTTVNLFGLQRRVADRLAVRLDTYQDEVLRRTRSAAAYQTLSGTLLSYAELAVLLGAGYLVIRGDLTVGGLFAFMSAYWRVVRSFESISRLVPALATLEAAFVRMHEFALLPSRHPPSTGTQLALERIGFGFGERPIIQDFSLAVAAGERVLVTGGNGTGKSTLAHIITGLLSPRAGRAVIPQPSAVSAMVLPFAFLPGTVHDNLDIDALDADQRARCTRLAERLGLDDKLDRDPATLSQGEQRRLQVLMTLLRPAEYYVFDEPLANVDAESKRTVFETILTETRGATLLVILHGDEHLHGAFDRQVQLDVAVSCAA